MRRDWEVGELCGWWVKFKNEIPICGCAKKSNTAKEFCRHAQFAKHLHF